MIFVTTGTSYKFDELVKEIDKIAPLLKEEVIIQIGKSDYKPKNCKYFRFAPSLISYIKKANLVICHGGAGTTTEVLCIKKKLISVENKNVNDSHQWDILKKFDSMKYLIWCRDITQIFDCIKNGLKEKRCVYKKPPCNIHKYIKRALI